MSDGLITAEPISVFRTIDRLAAAATAAALLVLPYRSRERRT